VNSATSGTSAQEIELILYVTDSKEEIVLWNIIYFLNKLVITEYICYTESNNSRYVHKFKCI
jgi:hypothetical protein